ncbi:MAG: YfcC family protein [Clostridia bacterium]|nr:YfcC family protein [Clostridia bacterium]
MVINMEKEKKRKFRVPHVFSLLMIIILICAILSYIVPAGSYERVDFIDPNTGKSRTIIDADSFQYIERTPVSLMTLLSSLAGGMAQVSDIIFFVFIVGGSIAVLQASGAIEGGLMGLAKRLKGYEIIVIPVIMVLITTLGVIMGACEEMIPLIPIMVALALQIGFDSITGTAMIIGSTAAGFSCSVLNPFNVGVAQGIAELPAFSGAWYRIIMAIIMLGVTIFMVCRYALKVKKNPAFSSMHEFDKTREEVSVEEKDVKFGVREKICLVIFVLTIVFLVWGVIQKGWYFYEIGALFLGMAILVAIVSNMGLNGFGKALSEGMTNICSGALVIGVANGILWILTQGNILDTILHAAASVLTHLPSWLSAVGMYIFQCLMNYLIPSGSGQAAVTMPILAPLSDLVGVTRQTAVIAFQLGDGISNAITPTSGVLMASLALAKIPWEKWAKWFLPIMLVQYGIGIVFVIVAQLIQLGPF